ncbi:uncharacterized protein LOC130806231 isoform X1 [Amaranthus tricolor]|uniref:uncharacterized protein LOC130806231 isoform X1 n=2 Tax=Amaranthus tricolor TaxID=29722 RepID=UPI002590BC83|nr:uncharacterized protein LOC130806231 isoform X1 [Amaranthus tricolor]
MDVKELRICMPSFSVTSVASQFKLTSTKKGVCIFCRGRGEMKPHKRNARDVNDEVEELLRAAEDANLLKLNLNSHTVHASPSDLHPELEQRFRYLKSGSKSKAKQESMTKQMAPSESAKVEKEVEEDDLLARFAALKASLPKPSSSISSSFVGMEISGTSVGDMRADGSSGSKAESHDEDEDEDEVEKVIKWAMDAARLDPSPSSDDEDNTKDDNFDDSETSDEDTESPQKNRKGPRK